MARNLRPSISSAVQRLLGFPKGSNTERENPRPTTVSISIGYPKCRILKRQAVLESENHQQRVKLIQHGSGSPTRQACEIRSGRP